PPSVAAAIHKVGSQPKISEDRSRYLGFARGVGPDSIGQYLTCSLLAIAMAAIFINYRRDDAFGVAGRLFDRLTHRFPRSEIFMDVDTMKPGLNFAKQLDEQVAKCDVVLTVIGPGWLNATDEKGRRKIDLPRDYVRIELASALKRDIPVIPLL